LNFMCPDYAAVHAAARRSMPPARGGITFLGICRPTPWILHVDPVKTLGAVTHKIRDRHEFFQPVGAALCRDHGHGCRCQFSVFLDAVRAAFARATWLGRSGHPVRSVPLLRAGTNLVGPPGRLSGRTLWPS